ncbi:DUF4381 family protein [Dyella sedimenti]|uniref:DUF4381 family protein n=1 Tax=Dyella sedimenti TaxID=2919947 RepID=UPI001FA9517D|nr:DUF4381 family protein [Dyella sedimenti]
MMFASSQAQGPTLRDIHLPPAPSWWPPAPGWWILATLIVLLALLAVGWWRHRRRRRAAEQAVMAEMDAIVSRWSGQPAQLAAALHQLLRRVALRFDAGAAQRQGDAWRHTLAMVTADPAVIDRLMALESSLYRPGVSFDVAATVEAVRQWLRLAWRRGNAGRTAVYGVTVAPEPGHA